MARSRGIWTMLTEIGGMLVARRMSRRARWARGRRSWSLRSLALWMALDRLGYFSGPMIALRLGLRLARRWRQSHA